MSDLKIDSHKLMYHPLRVNDWLIGSVVYPIYVEIGLTNRCNHRCIFCALDWVEKDRTDIDKKVMLETLEEMAHCGVKSVMFAGEGEPLMHKDVCLFIQHAKNLGMDVAMTTNGVLFTASMAMQCLPYLSWIRFSVDAGCWETYHKIHTTRGFDFDKVMSNIKYATELKRESNYKVEIGVQYLLIPDNVDEVLMLAKKLNDIGVDNLQIKPYSHHPDSKNEFAIDYKSCDIVESQLRGLDLNLDIYFRRETMFRIQEDAPYDTCHGLNFFTLVDAKGNVLPCNLYYNNDEFSYGNLYENNFFNVWYSEKRQEVLKKLKKKGLSECRKGCRLDAINRYLARLQKPERHDNFI